MLTSTGIYCWQYNGTAPWIEIHRWCVEHLGNRFWTNYHETVYFNNNETYSMFLLRWA